VRRLDVFGSAADDRRFDSSRSDVTLVVEFELSSGYGAADRYFGLLGYRTSLLGRPVELVAERAVQNPYLRQRIEASRRPLYVASAAS
jgi:uncharacterized protein